MKFKTILGLVLLLFILVFTSCGSKNPEMSAPETAEEAEKIIAARNAEMAKNADKRKKEAVKQHLSKQSKEVRKSIKRNAKRQKRREKLINQRKKWH